ncbi:MAG: hypothetical protein GXY83_28620 [Rhodopirellula sp.]|nr:hypothetical protein [Rhodopirellula sp.]
MASRQLDEEAIFHVARGLADAELRSTYLDQACAGDHSLRERVKALLDVHEREQDFLKSSPEPAPTIDQPPISERPGTTIGRYRLMEQIDEGGMGVVEQERPLRRKDGKGRRGGITRRRTVTTYRSPRAADLLKLTALSMPIPAAAGRPQRTPNPCLPRRDRW